jgi:hypothetical protein
MSGIVRKTKKKREKMKKVTLRLERRPVDKKTLDDLINIPNSVEFVTLIKKHALHFDEPFNESYVKGSRSGFIFAMSLIHYVK